MRDIIFLVVDKDAEAMQHTVNALNYLGHEGVCTARNGNEAWSILNLKKDLGCIISAWDMPQMNGIALLGVVRSAQFFSDLPFFLIIDNINRGQVIEAGEAGVSGIIVRPFTMDCFKKKIKSIGEIREEFADFKSQQCFDKAAVYLETKNYDKALAEFKGIVDQTENAEVYYNIGYIKTSQGKYEEAIIAFRKATQINKMFAKAYRGMGIAYKKLGRKIEAEDSLQKAADIYMNKAMDENAEKVLLEILQINPNTINVFNSLGILYRKQKNFEKALEQYKRAIKVDPNEEKIYYNMGRLYLEMKQLKKAKAAFSNALKLNPDFDEAREILKAVEIGIL